MQQNINWENKLTTDKCARIQKEKDNRAINEYSSFNYFSSSPCSRKDIERSRVVAVATCGDSLHSTITHGPERKQLLSRNFKAVPDFSRGCLNFTVTESVLLNGQDTRSGTCRNYGEYDFHRFVPLIDCMKTHILGYGQANQAGMDTREAWRCSSRSKK